MLVDRALMAYRWVVLLCTLDPADRPPLAGVMRIFFVSTFLGTFLPASVGGDAVRAYSLAKLNVGGGDAVASVFMDRMLGVASVLVMAVVGLGSRATSPANSAIVASLGVTAAACAVTLLRDLQPARGGARLAASSRDCPAALQQPGQRMLESIRRYASHHGAAGQRARLLGRRAGAPHRAGVLPGTRARHRRAADAPTSRSSR